jgi:dihydropteroate synthase
MGVLNVTPDSFSDGGRFLSPEAAVRRVGEMVAEGADWIDVGGESTRPGSQSVPGEEQIRRVLPAIRVAVECDVVVSIDTTRADVAEAALDAGASIVNDISAGRDDPAMLPLVAERGAAVVLMHMQGTPATMQLAPRYDDVVGEVFEFLAQRRDAAVQAGVTRERILLDPGIGFGKTTEHNLRLMRELRRFRELGQPLLVGTSRKRFIGEVTERPDPADRLLGTAATVSWSIANGAAVVRVHDVSEMRQVLRMTEAMMPKR